MAAWAAAEWVGWAAWATWACKTSVVSGRIASLESRSCTQVHVARLRLALHPGYSLVGLFQRPSTKQKKHLRVLFLFGVQTTFIRNLRIIKQMKAVFVELPPFNRVRAEYLDEEAFLSLQLALLSQPDAGDLIQGTGGLRKLRHADPRRGKGKRGGLRVIYYWWLGGDQFWLFTVYDKDEADDLNAKERKALKALLDAELKARKS